MLQLSLIAKKKIPSSINNTDDQKDVELLELQIMDLKKGIEKLEK